MVTVNGEGNGNSLIRVRGLDKKYVRGSEEIHVLQGLNLDVQAGLRLDHGEVAVHVQHPRVGLAEKADAAGAQGVGGAGGPFIQADADHDKQAGIRHLLGLARLKLEVVRLLVRRHQRDHTVMLPRGEPVQLVTRALASAQASRAQALMHRR